MSERDDDRPADTEDEQPDEHRATDGEVSATDDEVTEPADGGATPAEKQDEPATDDFDGPVVIVSRRGKDAPSRTPEEAAAAMSDALKGLAATEKIQRMLRDAAPKITLPPIPGLDRSSAVAGRIMDSIRPEVIERPDFGFTMPPPGATADQLEELNDAAKQQGVHLAEIVDIMAESVALSREATEAAKATAAQAEQNQRWAVLSLWVVTGFTILQLIIAIIEVQKP